MTVAAVGVQITWDWGRSVRGVRTVGCKRCEALVLCQTTYHVTSQPRTGHCREVRRAGVVLAAADDRYPTHLT